MAFWMPNLAKTVTRESVMAGYANVSLAKTSQESYLLATYEQHCSHQPDREK
jgi:hypothetical protein